MNVGRLLVLFELQQKLLQSLGWNLRMGSCDNLLSRLHISLCFDLLGLLCCLFGGDHPDTSLAMGRIP